jgi:hypothetical protein
MLAQGGEPTQPGGGGSPGGGGGVGGIEIQDVWLDREYVYVPSNASGYVDEFIAQIDRFNTVWYILQDANFNVLGLTDSGGELVEQRTYDPYGELLTRESFTAHPGFKAGHQGLFFDRLEPSPAVGGSISLGAASQLEPSTFGIYTARNRSYFPRYARWGQADPNGTGLLTSIVFWGRHYTPFVSIDAPSLGMALIDGNNCFAFVQNNPYNTTDPMGLFGFVQGLMTGLSLFDTMTGVLDQAHQGVELGANYASTSVDYAFEQMLMVDWALDWNASDRELGLVEERFASDYGNGASSRFVVGKSKSWAKGKRPSRARSGYHNHHIATHWGKRGKAFHQLFKEAGMDLHTITNVMEVTASSHRGRHTNKYHDMVMADLRKASDAAGENARKKQLPPKDIQEARRQAINNALARWRERINNDPSIMYIK